MNEFTLTQLRQSLERCSDSDGFLDSFYQIFFRRAPHLKARFQEVDMDVQKQRLAARLPKLLSLPTLAPDSPELRTARLEHQARHAGGERDNYALWIEAVCETFSRHDRLFNAGLEASLRETLETAVGLLTEPVEPSKVG